MSHSTIGRDIGGFHLVAIHNSDHSGPTILRVVRTKDDQVVGELEVPDGDMLVELALRVAAQYIEQAQGEQTKLASKVAFAGALIVVEHLLEIL